MSLKGSKLFLPVFVLLIFPFHRSSGQSAVQLKRAGNRIDVLVDHKPFTSYYFGLEAPKPYLHPLRSARGTIVTRGFPMASNVPGESHDHPHHRGMFFAHGDINGIDFWGEAQFAEKAPVVIGGRKYSSENLPKGRTVFRKLEEMRSSPDSAIIRATFDLAGADGNPFGGETQSYTIRGDASDRIIDCEFAIIANRGRPLKMGDTKEGTFAIRVVKALEEPQGHMLNSEGGVGEKGIWGKRADWVDYSGTVMGEKVGIAIFDHPTSVKHPTYWHARAYGLFAVNPFGEHDFYNDPKRDGSVTIPAGGSLTFRYRVLIHDGDAHEAKVAQAYQRYAQEK